LQLTPPALLLPPAWEHASFWMIHSGLISSGGFLLLGIERPAASIFPGGSGSRRPKQSACDAIPFFFTDIFQALHRTAAEGVVDKVGPRRKGKFAPEKNARD